MDPFHKKVHGPNEQRPINDMYELVKMVIGSDSNVVVENYSIWHCNFITSLVTLKLLYS